MNGIRFEDHSDEIRSLLADATEAAAREIGGRIAQHARDSVAKARGPLGNPWPQDVVTALRQSISAQVELRPTGATLTVGSNMQVAPYIELGTGKLYDPPPEWIEYHGHDAHSVGGLDSWLYYDKLEGVVKVGKPVPATPFLRPAIMDHIDEYKAIVERHGENA